MKIGENTNECKTVYSCNIQYNYYRKYKIEFRILSIVKVKS